MLQEPSMEPRDAMHHKNPTVIEPRSYRLHRRHVSNTNQNVSKLCVPKTLHWLMHWPHLHAVPCCAVSTCMHSFAILASPFKSFLPLHTAVFSMSESCVECVLEAAALLLKHGRNELQEKRTPKWLVFLQQVWWLCFGYEWIFFVLLSTLICSLAQQQVVFWVHEFICFDSVLYLGCIKTSEFWIKFCTYKQKPRFKFMLHDILYALGHITLFQFLNLFAGWSTSF